MLGFFYSDEVPDIKGNQGFWDQNLALHWVQDNIRAFGGNPDQVTIMGQSAGGWSLSAHILSPASRGLYKNAIMMSGALVEYKLILPPEDHVARFLTGIRKVGCADANDKSISKKVIECLEKLDPFKVEQIYNLSDKDPLGM